VVFIFKGTPIGLIPWRLLTQETKKQNAEGEPVGNGLGSNADDDRFGAALAVGDFNNDSIRDLAVGAPGDRLLAEGKKTGAVYLYLGKKKDQFDPDERTGLQPWIRVGPEEAEDVTGRDGDGFGGALAASPLYSGSTWDNKIAIGAPGFGADGKQQGAVFIWASRSEWVDESYEKTKVVAKGIIQVIAAPNQNDHLDDGFGRALAFGWLRDGGCFELAVGAPYERVQGKDFAGQVHIYQNNEAGTVMKRVETLDADVLGEPTVLGLFGRALATGDLDGDAEGIEDLAVSGNGKVFFWKGNKADAALEPWDDLSPAQFSGNHGDYFGAALAIGQLDGTGPEDVAVGGIGVYVARGKAGGPTPWKYLAPAGELTPNAYLGDSVTIGNFDGKDGNDIVAGAPGNDQWSGAVERWRRDGAALEEAQVITQETTGP
jgi:hypothetical protein